MSSFMEKMVTLQSCWLLHRKTLPEQILPIGGRMMNMQILTILLRMRS